MFCPKPSRDPLMVAMSSFDLFPVIPPAGDLEIGAVLAFDKQGFRSRTTIQSLLADPIGPKPWTVKRTFLSEFVGSFSNHLDSATALELAGEFAQGWVLNDQASSNDAVTFRAAVELALKDSAEAKISVGVADAIHLRADPAEIQDAIGLSPVKTESPFLDPGLQLYLVHRTWSARKAALLAHTGNRRNAGFGAAIAGALKAFANLDVDIVQDGEITFGNPSHPLCFAADAFRLRRQGDGLRADLKAARPQRSARGEEEPADELIRFSIEQTSSDNAFLDLTGGAPVLLASSEGEEFG